MRDNILPFPDRSQDVFLCRCVDCVVDRRERPDLWAWTRQWLEESLEVDKAIEEGEFKP